MKEKSVTPDMAVVLTYPTPSSQNSSFCFMTVLLGNISANPVITLTQIHRITMKDVTARA